MKKIIVAIVVAVAVVFAAGEFGVRWLIGNELAQQSPQAQIAFGPTPVLLSLVTGTIPEVDVETESTLSYSPSGDSFEGTPASQVHMEGLNTKTNTALFMRVTTMLPDAFLTIVAQQGLEQQLSGLMQAVVRISAVTSDPQTGTVQVEFTEGAASLVLEPSVRNGALSFAATEATLLGFDLPEGVVDRISSALSEAAQSQAQNEAMSVEAVEAIDGGVRLTLTGHYVEQNTVEYAGQ